MSYRMLDDRDWISLPASESGGGGGYCDGSLAKRQDCSLPRMVTSERFFKGRVKTVNRLVKHIHADSRRHPCLEATCLSRYELCSLFNGYTVVIDR